MPSQWEVWVELIVPLFGAVSSSAVAVVAVWVTLRLARVERANEERRRRTAWAIAVQRFSRIPIDTPDTPILQDQALAEMDAAAVGLRDFEDIADWLSEEERVLFHSRRYNSLASQGKQELRDMTWGRLWLILAEWAETGIWSRPEVDKAPEDVAAAERLNAALVQLAQRQAGVR